MKKRIFIVLAMTLSIASVVFSAQHDYDIANAPGATVRADINNVLNAIATNNSGATAPTSTFPNQWWKDTSTNLLKIRDNSDTAWITTASKSGTTWIPYRAGTPIGTGSTLTKDTDTSLAANSDSNVATQKAVKAYADSINSSALHKSTSAEISAMTEKTTPVDDDWLVLEDSEASNAKKKVKVGNLPGVEDYFNDFGRDGTVVMAFNHSSGGKDISSYRNALTLTNLDTGDLVSGKVSDYVYDFDGSTEKVLIAQNELSQGMSSCTIEMWLYPDSIATTTFILDGPGTNEVEMRISSGNWTTQVKTSSGIENFSGDAHGLTTSAWNHVVLVFDNSTTGKIYVNGSLQSTGDNAGNGTLNIGALSVGSTTAGGDYWNGRIDGLRVIPGLAWDASTVSARYNDWN